MAAAARDQEPLGRVPHRVGGRCAQSTGSISTVDTGDVVGVVGESRLGQDRGHAGGHGPPALDRRRSPPTGCRSRASRSWASARRQRRALIGKDMAMIFQEPMTSLNPCFTVGFQITEAIRAHEGMRRGSGAQAGAGALGPGRHPVAAGPARRLPAPALGRHEPAGDDRHGDRLQPEAPDRRRADHGTRRHHPGADPGPAARPAARARHGADPDHPRHGRGRRDGRARRRPVCRPAGRGAGRDRPVRGPACTPTRQRCWRPCPSGRSAGCCRPSRAWCRACCDRPAGCLFNPRCAIRHRQMPRGPAAISPTARAAGCAATTRSPAACPRGTPVMPASRHDRVSGSLSPRGSSATTASAAACSRRPARSRRCAASASPSTAAAHWRWSGNPAAARPRSPAWSP